MQLLTKSSYGCQKKHHSRHTSRKNLIHEKMHCVIARYFIKRLDHVSQLLQEIKSVEAEVQREEPVVVRCRIFHSSKSKTAEIGAL